MSRKLTKIDFSSSFCGPSDINGLERMFNNYKRLYESLDKASKEQIDNWLMDIKVFDKVMKNPPPLAQRFINEFLNDIPKVSPEHYYSQAKKYSLSLWDRDTIVKIQDKGGRLRSSNDSPAKIVMNHFNQRNQDKILIIRSQTGTGKSVLMPQLVFYARLPYLRTGKIICAQPRRLNAISLAGFVAGGMCSAYDKKKKIVNLVGYNVGGEKLVKPETMIVYQTIGKLLQDIKSSIQSIENAKDSTEKRRYGQALANKYDTIILDEVHERSIDQDLLLGLLLRIDPQFRPRIVVMSATIDYPAYFRYFDKVGADYFFCQLGAYEEKVVGGKTIDSWNVTEKNITTGFETDDSDDYQMSIVKKVGDICKEDKDITMGILIFVGGQGEISQLMSALKKKYKNIFDYFELTRNSSTEFETFNKSVPKKRRLIISTNVAETGITFYFVGHVIDSGWQKVSVYDPEKDCNILISTCIAQDNAIQRRGRIGRLKREGYKYHPIYTRRIWTLMDQENKFSTPKIYTSDISSVILMLRDLFPTQSMYSFHWLDKPSSDAISAGLHKLFHLGALNTAGNLTPIGKFMNNGSLARISMEGRKALYTSRKMGVMREVATVLAMERELESIKFGNYCTPLIFPNIKSDHITLLYIYQTYAKKAKTMANGHLRQWCIENCLNPDTMEEIPTIIDEILGAFEDDFPDPSKIPSYTPKKVSIDTIHLKVLQCLFSGYFMKTGELPNKGSKVYHLDAQNVFAKIDNASSFAFTNPKTSYAIYPKHIMYSGLRMSKSVASGIAQYKMNLVSEINPNWFGNYAPDYNLIA